MNVLVTGGVHGDEPSGAAALEGLSRDGFATFGPCNPWGLAHGRRTLADGRDLNRQFGNPHCVEAERVRAFVRAHPPAVLLDLHEAHGVHGFLIQFGPHDPLGRRVIDRVRDGFALSPRPGWGPVRGRDGLLRPSSAALGIAAFVRRFSLGHWTHHAFGCTAFVVEAAAGWPLAQRIAFHRAVVHAVREALGSAP